MKVVEVRPVEDCFDGSRIVELRLDGKSDEGFIRHMGTLGDLEYFPEFSRPFFRITRPRRSAIRGVEGERSFRVVLFTDPEGELDMIESHVQGLEP